MKKFLAILLSLLLCGLASAQQYVSSDADFIDYLIGNGMAKDAQAYLEGTPFAASDTLQFLKGRAAYSARSLEKAEKYFETIGPDSPFFDRAVFYNAVSCVHLGLYGRAAETLSLYPDSGAFAELKHYELAGVALLKGDLETYEAESPLYNHTSFALSEGAKVFDDIYSRKLGFKSKSPFAAGLLSAAVPGLGKIYAGRLDEGIASFLAVGTCAAITAESWVKNGFKDWRTILFGAIGSILYIGNIYGSCVSVGLYNNAANEAWDTAVVLNVHIPLRNLFE